MNEKSEGLVLRIRPYSETSLIVEWLTLEWGRISTLAKGARRPTSPLAGKLDLYFRSDLSFRRSRRSDLHTLVEVTVRDFRSPLRRDWNLLQKAAYCSRLLERATERETPVEDLYRAFNAVLDALCRTPSSPVPVLAFEIRLLLESGEVAGWDDWGLSEAAGRLVQQLAFSEPSDWPCAMPLPTWKEATYRAGVFLERYLGFRAPEREASLTGPGFG